MNILFIDYFIVGFMVSEIRRVSVFGNCPFSVTLPYLMLDGLCIILLLYNNIYLNIV